MSEVQQETEKTTKEVLFDYAREIAGYDQGMLRTVIDLRKDPAAVLQSYLSRDYRYVGPFRILLTTLSLWVLINSFFVDWYAIWERNMIKMGHWAEKLVDIPPDRVEKFRSLIQKAAVLTGDLFGDLFAKYYVPFVLLAVPVASYLAARKTKAYGVDIRKLIAAVGYSFSWSIFIMLAFSALCYFDVILAAVVIGIPVITLTLIGKSHLIFPLPYRRFFATNGMEIEKQIHKAFLVSTLILFLPLIGYYYYQIFTTLLPGK